MCSGSTSRRSTARLSWGRGGPPSTGRLGNRRAAGSIYFGDHTEAVRLLGEWQDALFRRPVKRIVELGGNASPMIAQVVAPKRVNVDIDPFGMLVGNLLREGEGTGVGFVIADGMALPMRPKSIEMLVMFATFHHFPDPVGLLARLSEFVADDGLICLMCEPLGHVRADNLPDEYLEEIRKGVNEQSFELWNLNRCSLTPTLMWSPRRSTSVRPNSRSVRGAVLANRSSVSGADLLAFGHGGRPGGNSSAQALSYRSGLV